MFHVDFLLGEQVLEDCVSDVVAIEAETVSSWIGLASFG